MIIDCVSDLHGFYPKLKGGDLLIVAGDLTARDEPIQYGQFAAWFDRQKYTKKILISGNHDNFFENEGLDEIQDAYKSLNVDYLCDSGTEFEGLKIWGSPWTKTFKGMNPKCKAFTCDTEKELAIKFSLIPDDTDILITHSPSYGIFDFCDNHHVGSKSLRRIMAKSNPKLWVCGHIHEGYGEFKGLSHKGIYHIVNASYVNERYEPVNKPIRVIL